MASSQQGFGWRADSLGSSTVRTITALLLPALAAGLQWLLWPVIRPFVWFLFFPVVFFSAWLGSFAASLGASLFATGLVWWFFLEPTHTLVKPRLGTYLNAGMFLAMAVVIAWFQRRLREAGRKAREARETGQRAAFERERNRQLELMSGVAKVGGWSFDTASLKGTWTPETARIHDLDPAEPIDVERGLGYYHPDDRAQIEAAVRASIDQGRPFDLELRLCTASGALKWVRTMGEALRVDGRVVQVHGAMQDITGRKLAELALHDLNASLERRVAERTAELLSANQELDAFASAVSHDLRAPLRGMEGFSQALVEDFGEQLQAQGRLYLGRIVESSRRMGDIIDGLLQLSRCARDEMRLQQVDLSAMAQRIRLELEGSDGGPGPEWEVQPGLAAWGDERLLASVMHNLLANARKYSSRTKGARIRVYAEGEGADRWICVADNGAGFDMAYAGDLFQPFRRLHRMDEFPGIGIGLATVQRVIHRHGGSIRAEGAPGRGACFRFQLPAFSMPAAAAGPD